METEATGIGPAHCPITCCLLSIIVSLWEMAIDPCVWSYCISCWQPRIHSHAFWSKKRNVCNALVSDKTCRSCKSDGHRGVEETLTIFFYVTSRKRPFMCRSMNSTEAAAFPGLWLSAGSLHSHCFSRPVLKLQPDSVLPHTQDTAQEREGVWH